MDQNPCGVNYRLKSAQFAVSKLLGHTGSYRFLCEVLFVVSNLPADLLQLLPDHCCDFQAGQTCSGLLDPWICKESVNGRYLPE
jgi:hypothetical protein